MTQHRQHDALEDRPATDSRTPSGRDLDVLSRQLGRPVRDVVEIGARCVCGNPLVATTAPRLSNGIPFPTTYYLAHPVITAAVSRLEADGVMTGMSDRLTEDSGLADHYRAAHLAYLAARDAVGERAGTGPVPEIDGVSAGGMPTRVKCLHVLVGHALAAGPGVNPLGDEAISRIAPWWTPERCYCEGAWDTTGQAPHADLSRHTRTQGLSPEELEAKRAARRGAADAATTAPPRGEAMRTAAIDCGTNSIRLLIADVQDGVLTDVVRLMRVVRLGEGVDATGRLSEAALERTFAAAEEYAALIAHHGNPPVRFVATSASRDAENRQDFVDGIRARLGVEPEVVSGDEEARLSFDGAVSVLATAADETVLVIDLGGGSTEFVAGTAGGLIGALSTDMGCVRFTERFLRDDPPSEEQIAAMEAEVRRLVDQAADEVPLHEVTKIVGVAGSVTTVTAHALDLPAYQPDRIHGAELPIAAISAAASDLLHRPHASRASLPYMHPGRVDVIGAGALIWRTILDRVAVLTGGRVTTAVASEHDILDGIALSVARQGT
ncbi:DUF501 domain-containing protein [Arthrobacter sp. SX1312]|uniref:DUF501 domain-containing protein n=1 Tax=Arthrobacter sp. SX1312 TaxID=2058896 RepID=UPI0027D2D64F|nr:DUF501 domain-containing protein [Arthrobacter sp. SX1312]